MRENISLFMDITSTNDSKIAASFLEMSNDNLEAAVGLYFEHGTGIIENNNNSSTDLNTNIGSEPHGDIDTDAEFANKLQQEMYKEQHNDDNIRRPIEPTHDILLPQEFNYNFQNQLNNNPERNMFGSAEFGIFNQTSEDGISNRYDSNHNNDSDHEITEIDDLTGHYDFQSNGHNSNTSNNRITNTQRKLANIFRPPWEIISKLDLNDAKIEAKLENKWILINIQDVKDFRCQCLNRDFFSSPRIKDLIRKNFIFLQYHNDSKNGELYLNLYPINDFPHISILDPVTGERLLVWDKIPDPDKWISEVDQFLSKNSITNNNNFNQINDDGSRDAPIILNESEVEYESEIESAKEMDKPITPPPKSIKELTYSDKINLIEPTDMPDPSSDIDQSLITRIQIKSFIDGKRVIKKFLVDDEIIKIFQFVKFYFSNSIKNKLFTLKMQGTNLFDNVDKTIKDCKLMNSLIMLEAVEEEEYDEDYGDE